MSKRNKKDIKHISAKPDVTKGGTSSLPADQSLSPALSVESTVAKKDMSKSNANTMVLDGELNGVADPDLDILLGQVNQMLTEMTESKWLSADWPNLEIELGINKK